MMAPNITLYTTQSPDCNKVSIVLEELGLPYDLKEIDVSKHEQKSPWFLEINPNGRLPAMTDTLADGRTICLFESCSVITYLVDRYDVDHKISYPKGSSESYEVTNWLFFQAAGVGPTQGQAVHFLRYAPHKLEYPLSRYQNETRRLYRVLDSKLSSIKSGYLVHDRCTIADISLWGWVNSAFWAGIDIDEFPYLKQWEEKMMGRQGVSEGRHKPGRHFMKELASDLVRQREIEKKVSVWILEQQEKNKVT